MFAIFLMPMMAFTAQVALAQSIWGGSMAMSYSFSAALVSPRRLSRADLRLVSVNPWHPSQRSRAKLSLVR